MSKKMDSFSKIETITSSKSPDSPSASSTSLAQVPSHPLLTELGEGRVDYILQV